MKLAGERTGAVVNLFDLARLHHAVADLAEGRPALHPDQLRPAHRVDEHAGSVGNLRPPKGLRIAIKLTWSPLAKNTKNKYHRDQSTYVR